MQQYIETLHNLANRLQYTLVDSKEDGKCGESQEQSPCEPIQGNITE